MNLASYQTAPPCVIVTQLYHKILVCKEVFVCVYKNTPHNNRHSLYSRQFKTKKVHYFSKISLFLKNYFQDQLGAIRLLACVDGRRNSKNSNAVHGQRGVVAQLVHEILNIKKPRKGAVDAMEDAKFRSSR